MALQTYLVGPVKEGQQNDVKPFYMPEDAYLKLEDVYVWRGRIRKRFGYSLIGSNDLNSRLRINLGSTDGSGNFKLVDPDFVPGTIFKIGQMFSIDDEVFTVNAAGSPANMLKTGSATKATFNTTNGELEIEGSLPTKAVYFYPSEPVMGFRMRETSNVNQEETIAFDTQFAYERPGNGFKRLGDAIWSGSDSKFFWSVNYRGADSYETAFYCTNFVADDKIKYILSGSSEWQTLRPKLSVAVPTTRFLDTCRVIIHFKDRLIALNTVETIDGTKQNFTSRCRFSRSGDPRNEDTSWLDDEVGSGGFINAPTKEQIVSASRIRDKLIVYFERSTWELAYTGIKSVPFKWQRIDSVLGCEGTFSSIVFDETVVGVGNIGIHGCNGVSVSRIDEKIPSEVFKIHNGSDGAARVYAIRDFYNEVIYWTFPDQAGSPKFPTKILVYNYINNTWAFFNESFTCFGYYQKTGDLTWETADFLYENWSVASDTWGSPLFQSSFPNISSGNQQGFVFVLDNEKSSNGQSLYITDMDPASRKLTVINHNLSEGDYILMEESLGVTDLNEKVFQVQNVLDSDSFVIDANFEGTYTGGGKLSRISNFKVVSKSFNPGTPAGKKFRIPYLDFLLESTMDGEVSLNYFLDTNYSESVQELDYNNVLLGSNILYTKPLEKNQSEQSQIWHRHYIQAVAEFLQLEFFMSDSQMRDPKISRSGFELHAMLFYVESRGNLVQ